MLLLQRTSDEDRRTAYLLEQERNTSTLVKSQLQVVKSELDQVRSKSDAWERYALWLKQNLNHELEQERDALAGLKMQLEEQQKEMLTLRQTFARDMHSMRAELSRVEQTAAGLKAEREEERRGKESMEREMHAVKSSLMSELGRERLSNAEYRGDVKIERAVWHRERAAWQRREEDVAHEFKALREQLGSAKRESAELAVGVKVVLICSCTHMYRVVFCFIYIYI